MGRYMLLLHCLSAVHSATVWFMACCFTSSSASLINTTFLATFLFYWRLLVPAGSASDAMPVWSSRRTAIS